MEKCPERLQVEVIKFFLTCLDNPKKAAEICKSDIDTQIMLGMLKENRKFIPAYYDYVQRTQKLYICWIKKDPELYKIPLLIEKKYNHYLKVII